MRKGRTEQARAYFQTAASLAPNMFESHYNYARLIGRLKNKCSPKSDTPLYSCVAYYGIQIT